VAGAAAEESNWGRRVCVRHPQRQTLLACGRCGRPFCTDCLIYTPAGQRCYDCAGVRRDYAQRALLNRTLRAGGLVALGAAIASFAGIFGLLIAAALGQAAGQTLSASVSRQTRILVYGIGALALLLGATVGWTVASLVRVLTMSTQFGGGPLPLIPILIAVPLNLILAPVANWYFWLFVAITGALAYRRLR
jgi:hypothetical protein